MTGPAVPAPRVSVIIANWNGRELLRDCLYCLRNQTYQAFEVIVVDNASTDGSKEMLESEFPEVRCVPLMQNLGFCGGNNAGVRAARGEYVVLLNNDAYPTAGWLEALVAPMQDPRLGIAASRVVFYDHIDQLDSAGDGISITGSGYRRGHLQSPGRYPERERVFGASAAAALYRRAMLDDIGLLDEDFFHTYEDVDLSFRAQLAGYECEYVPNAIVFHKGWSTIGWLTAEYVYYGHRNTEYVFWQNMPGPLLWLCLIPHLAYEVGGFFYFARKGQAQAYGRAKRDALRHWRHVKAKRRLVQARRRVPVWAIARWLNVNFVPRMLREKFLND